MATMCGGLLLLGAICLLLIGGALLIGKHDKYIVRISTASGERNALVSRDRDYIQQIVAVLNLTMAC
jgi:hypothetical protein